MQPCTKKIPTQIKRDKVSVGGGGDNDNNSLIFVTILFMLFLLLTSGWNWIKCSANLSLRLANGHAALISECSSKRASDFVRTSNTTGSLIESLIVVLLIWKCGTSALCWKWHSTRDANYYRKSVCGHLFKVFSLSFHHLEMSPFLGNIETFCFFDNEKYPT